MTKPYFVKFPQNHADADGSASKGWIVHTDDGRFASQLVICNGDHAQARDAYFAKSRTIAEVLAKTVSEHNRTAIEGGKVAAGMSILDFGAQYANVSRVLGEYFPTARIIAGEVNENASYFDRFDLGLESAYLGADPRTMNVFYRFDVVLVNDFLTRVHPNLFLTWLNRAVSFAAKGGLVVVTTQGLVSLANRFAGNSLDPRGFYFSPSPNQSDPGAVIAGETVVAPSLVVRALESANAARVVEFREAAFFGYQDLFVIRRG